MAIQNPTDEKIKEVLHTSKRIAVVGLSGNPDRTSYMVSEAMQNAGYTIIPVNPTVDEVLGEKAVASLKEIDGEVDIVNVFRRSEFLPEVARDTVEIGAKTFWAQLGVANQEAFDYLKDNGVETIMDRCIKVEHAKFK
ncbi:CoA-binding protein [Alkalihalophilus marmarensis]|jgi:predicted CoA-binding protein|uniref:CoA-binding protein n=1 Tax=Alkalihalophilus marmarensis DSM 21297 TaxID=1188261 RepID=U6SUP3_9BACI|nr:CoA-binding protein [Alkalihalophilus marmarensis]ERN54361.1 CoA-binding protein [Alkalihalophilus marmarensis DSM 21297]MCM3488264.1 CoA-binding protein [Alkalihalophilus marmarensis]